MLTCELTHPEELLVCDVVGVRDGVTRCVRSSSSDEESIVKSITSCCGADFFSGDPDKKTKRYLSETASRERERKKECVCVCVRSG